MSTRKSTSTLSIPEAVQLPMRERLRMLRLDRGKFLRDLQSLSSGTITKFEKHDISSLRLGDIYGLSVEYNLSMNELLEYIVGNTTSETTPESRRVQRIATYLGGLDEANQELAISLVQRVVEHSINERDVRRLNQAPGNKRDGRKIVQEAVRKSNE